MGFSDVSRRKQAAFFGLIATLILFLTAFGSEYWLDYGTIGQFSVHAGLWTSTGESAYSSPAWFEAVQAMVCLALIAGFAAVILLSLHIYLPNCPTIVLTLTNVAPFAAGACSLIGVIIFGAEFGQVLDGSMFGWSFWLCTVSSILFIIFGVILVTDRRTE